MTKSQLRRLTHHLGPSTTNRIQNIYLHNKSLDLNGLCSALDIIIKTLPNLQNITIQLPSPLPSTSPLETNSAYRLWRSLQRLDRHLPTENAVQIKGIHGEGYEKLELKWRDKRKKWWHKAKSTRVLEKSRGRRTLSLRSDLCEDMGYPLPGRCPDYPINYYTFI